MTWIFYLRFLSNSSSNSPPQMLSPSSAFSLPISLLLFPYFSSLSRLLSLIPSLSLSLSLSLSATLSHSLFVILPLDWGSPWRWYRRREHLGRWIRRRIWQESKVKDSHHFSTQYIINICPNRCLESLQVPTAPFFTKIGIEVILIKLFFKICFCI